MGRHRDVVEPDHGDILGDAPPSLAQRGHDAERDRVVAAEDRVERGPLEQQAAHRRVARGRAVAAVRHQCRIEGHAGPVERLAVALMALVGRAVVRLRVAHVGDGPPPGAQQVAHGPPRGADVVDVDAVPLVAGRVAHGDEREAAAHEARQLAVIGPRVDHQQPVDLLGVHHLEVGAGPRDVLQRLDQHPEARTAAHLVEAEQRLRDDRVGGEVVRVAHDQPERPRAAAREAARGRGGDVPQLLGGLQHAAPRGRADARTGRIVEDERDGRAGNAREARHVLAGGAAPRAHGSATTRLRPTSPAAPRPPLTPGGRRRESRPSSPAAPRPPLTAGG